MIKMLSLILFVYSTNTLFAQNILVTTHENTFLYRWIDNQLKVIVEGRMCRDIIVQSNNGYIKLDASNCTLTYIADDTTIHRTVIDIGVKSKKGVQWLQKLDLPVSELPDPNPSVGGYPSNDSIWKNVLLAVNGLSLHRSHRVYQRLLGYSVRVLRGDSVIFEMSKLNGYIQFPVKLTDFIREQTLTGDEIVFYNISTSLGEKETRLLKTTYRLYIK